MFCPEFSQLSENCPDFLKFNAPIQLHYLHVTPVPVSEYMTQAMVEKI